MTPTELLTAMRDYERNEPEHTADALAREVLILRECRDVLADCLRTAEQELIVATEGMPPNAVIGGVTWRRATSTRRSGWRNEDLVREVVDQCRFSPSTGEARSPSELVAAVTEAFRFGGAEARATWMRTHGIDLDDFCETIDHRTTMSPNLPRN